MISVISSNVAAIGYDPHQGQLFVQFHHRGRTYVYSGVPQSVYGEFLQAPSKGQYVAWNIKGHYPYQQVA